MQAEQMTVKLEVDLAVELPEGAVCEDRQQCATDAAMRAVSVHIDGQEARPARVYLLGVSVRRAKNGR